MEALFALLSAFKYREVYEVSLCVVRLKEDGGDVAKTYGNRSIRFVRAKTQTRSMMVR